VLEDIKKWLVDKFGLLSIRRFSKNNQEHRLLEDETLFWHQELVVEVIDSSYSKKPYLCANRQHDNLVTICRVASNRTFYQKAKSTESPAPVGRYPNDSEQFPYR